MKQTKRATFTVLFYLKRTAPKADGTIPIMGRITINGGEAPFSPKLSISPTLDFNKNRVSGKTREAQEVNNKLKAIEARIKNIYDDMLKYGGNATAQKVKKKYSGQKESGSFLLKCYEELMKEVEIKVEKKLRAPGTYGAYKSGYNQLKKFIKKKYNKNDIELIELDKKFIDDYDYYLRIEKKLEHNSIYANIGPLLRTINKALTDNLLVVDPFRHYKNTLVSKDRGYLLKDEIKKIIEYTPPEKISDRKKNTLKLIRDLFLFSCFTGFAYADIKGLKKEHLQSFFDGNQWLIKRRQKSKVPCNVRLLEIPQMILRKYEGLDCGNFLLPVPSNTICNQYIKEIMNCCEIYREKSITFHWARHSFATLMLTEDIPIESVSKMLGHKHISTTEIYAKITNQKISQDMEIASQRLKNMAKNFI